MAKRLVGLIFRRNSDGDNKSEKERKELQDAKTKEVQEAVDTVAAEIAAKALSIVQAQLHENGQPSEVTEVTALVSAQLSAYCVMEKKLFWPPSNQGLRAEMIQADVVLVLDLMLGARPSPEEQVIKYIVDEKAKSSAPAGNNSLTTSANVCWLFLQRGTDGKGMLNRFDAGWGGGRCIGTTQYEPECFRLIYNAEKPIDCPQNTKNLQALGNFVERLCS